MGSTPRSEGCSRRPPHSACDPAAVAASHGASGRSRGHPGLRGQTAGASSRLCVSNGAGQTLKSSPQLPVVCRHALTPQQGPRATPTLGPCRPPALPPQGPFRGLSCLGVTLGDSPQQSPFPFIRGDGEDPAMGLLDCRRSAPSRMRGARAPGSSAASSVRGSRVLPGKARSVTFTHRPRDLFNDCLCYCFQVRGHHIAKLDPLGISCVNFDGAPVTVSSNVGEN